MRAAATVVGPPRMWTAEARVAPCRRWGRPTAASHGLGSGVDTDPEKIRVLSEGRAWFVEDGLDECLTRHVRSGRLRFTTDPGEAAEAQVHFVGVGTPTGADGMSYDMSQVMSAVRGLAPHLRRPTLLVGKSTVTVGTTVAVTDAVQSLAPAGQSVKVAWNPEFLREGHAVTDTLRPDRIVVGVQNSESAELLREVYGPILEATGGAVHRHEPCHVRIGQGCRQRVLGDDDVVHQCDGRGVRGGGRGRGSPGGRDW